MKLDMADNDNDNDAAVTLSVLSSLFSLPGECTVLEDRFDEEHGNCLIRIDLENNLHGKLLQVKASVPKNPASLPRIRVLQPLWLAKRPYEDCVAQLAKHLESLDMDKQDTVGRVLDAVEWLKQFDFGAPEASQPSLTTDGACQPSDTFCRIWMHLPSLSSRSKRQDLVRYAPLYSVTGVVCAGKPGLLILEAPSPSHCESFMAYIKSVSWSDIPSGHKKVSERLRESNLASSERKFVDMQEMTEMLNSDGMKGSRGNRGDLGALQAWLIQKGLGGDRLATVLGAHFASIGS